jgi:hypothetical protein
MMDNKADVPYLLENRVDFDVTSDGYEKKIKWKKWGTVCEAYKQPQYFRRL